MAFALLIGVCACWLGVTAMQRARRSGSLRPASSIAGTVLGVTGAGLSALMLIHAAMFWQPLTLYSQCLQSASTVTAQQACANQLHRSTGITEPASPLAVASHGSDEGLFGTEAGVSGSTSSVPAHGST